MAALNKDRQDETQPETPRSHKLDVTICVAVISVAGVALVVLGITSWNQMENYNRIIDRVVENQQQIDHAALIAYMRSSHFSTVKGTALIFSFLVVLIGSLYIQRVATTHFHLEAQSRNLKGVFLTTSPGLVMVTLGVILVIVSLVSESAINYSSGYNPEGQNEPPESLPQRKPITTDVITLEGEQ